MKLIIFIVTGSLLIPTMPAIGKDKHKECIDSKDYSKCMNHQNCLDAKDYEGCMTYQDSSKGSKSVSITNKEMCMLDGGSQVCIAGEGEDILGYPKLTGWLYRSVPEKPGVYYSDLELYKVKVRGKYGRYIEFKEVIRYYQEPIAGTPRSKLWSTDSKTTCTDHSYGSTYGSVQCTTTPGKTTYIGGTPATPGGVRTLQYHTIFDCEEKTIGTHKGNQLQGKWKKFSQARELDVGLAKKNCPIINTLKASTFMKYAK